jgi:Carboxypeptidase regulatory-like domain
MMFRKFGLFLVLAQFSVISVFAAGPDASVTGQVRNARGTPQMGAVVEVLGNALGTFKALTDENGFYAVSGLLPGTYNLRVSAPSFLPALRERVGLKAGVGAVVNVTLSSLFEAIQMPPLNTSGDGDDWKWVLRSASNRPILRFEDDGGVVALASAESRSHASAFHDVTGSLSFLAGSSASGFGGSSDMSTDFSLEKPLFSDGLATLSGNLGYGYSTPATVLRASYSKLGAFGSPTVSVTARSLASPDLNLHNSDFQSIALTTSDDVKLGDVVELKFGSELQAIQFLGRVSAFRPFGSADFHLSPDTVLGYAYATSEPDNVAEKGFDREAADLGDSGPRMSISGYRASLERAHHHEVSLSHREGRSTIQLAVYADRISDPALTGVGAYSAVSGEVLPDVYSGTFTYRGRRLDANGVRMELESKLTSAVTSSVTYAYGGVLDLDNSNSTLEEVRDFSSVKRRHALTGKIKGTLPGSKTSWIASYRWTSGQALTPVDMFDASHGQADPYLNLFFRQPLPSIGFLAGHMEAMVDLRNLLAQGYVPVVGADGHTVYLVQAARSVRGGVAFTF